MSKIIEAALTEVIFELKWGENSPGNFKYSQEEQQLLPGKVSVAAMKAGYPLVLPLLKSGLSPMPFSPTHRFLSKENTWPCLQLGLGIFTVNQVNEGYAWSTFKEDIEKGLQVMSEANPNILNDIIDTASVALNYQDAFYPTETETIEKYLEEHFQIIVKLPNLFLENSNINDNINSINVNLTIPSHKPEGIISILLANGMINGTPGLILRTTIQSKLSTILKDEDFIGSIATWSEEAHDVQKHAFETLVEHNAEAEAEA